MNTCDCPKCHSGDIETDDCFDVSHSNSEIIEYYVGHCLACGQSYQWEKHYKFAFQTDFEED